MYDAYYWRGEMNTHQRIKIDQLKEELETAPKSKIEFIKEYIKLLEQIAKNNFRFNTGAKK